MQEPSSKNKKGLYRLRRLEEWLLQPHPLAVPVFPDAASLPLQ